MNSQNDSDRFLTIGEAARTWRVSPDSLRGWTRKGVLHPVVTPGGHNRFRERELVAVLGNPRIPKSGGSEGSRAAPGRRVSISPELETRASSRGGPRTSLETGVPEVDDARAELEVARAWHETSTLRREMKLESQQAAALAEAERIRGENARQHEELKAYGRSLTVRLPIEWRQRVITMLEGFVKAENVPPSLPQDEARVLVAAQVQEIQQQYDEEQSRELSEAIGRLRVQALVNEGMATARLLTLPWDPRDADDARAEVEHDLAGSVRPDWTEADLNRRVRHILEQWEEVEDEDDLDADGDSGENDWDEEERTDW